jgi:large subunit ribosomal protein L24
MQNKLHIKIGDTVRVITGESKGQEGEILSIDRINLRAVVKGLNLVKKHVKPTASNPQGGIEEKEAAIHVSNLMVVINGEATKIGRKPNEDGKIVRFSKKSGEVIK